MEQVFRAGRCGVKEKMGVGDDPALRGAQSHAGAKLKSQLKAPLRPKVGA